MMAGMIIIPGSVVRTQAAETDDSEKSLVPVTGIENILEASYQTEIKNNINLYLVPTEEGEYLNIAFSNTGDYTCLLYTSSQIRSVMDGSQICLRLQS